MFESQQEIISGIKVYINECCSDYAVMLNGSWGSGKTYFVKNELIPVLEEMKAVIYISLFGIKCVDDLINVITMHVLNIYSNKRAQKRAEMNIGLKISNKQASSSVSQIPSVFVGIINKGLKLVPNGDTAKAFFSDIQKNTINFADYVFIFDDFERSVIDKIELLGLFDEMVEQNHAKVIIVCNEVALLKKAEKDDENLNNKKAVNNTEEKILIDDYNLYKEKVVGFTINYAADLSTVYRKILDNIIGKQSNCYDCLIEYKSEVLELFSRVGSHNLRTLIFVLKRFKELEHEIELAFDDAKIDKKYYSRYIALVLCNVTSVSIMYKDFGMSDVFIPKDRDVVVKPFSSDGFAKDMIDFNINNHIRLSRYVNQYIYDYSLNKDLLLQDITRFVLGEMNDIKNNTDKIDSIYCLDSDIEATKRLDSVLEDIKENQYCLGLYPRILSNLFILIEILYDESNSKLELLKKDIIKNVKARADEFDVSSWHYFNSVNTKANAFNEELCSIVEKTFLERKKQKYRYALDDEKDFVEHFRELVKDDSSILGDRKSMLNCIPAPEMIDKFINLPNSNIREINGILRYNYLNVKNINDLRSGDLALFREMETILDKEIPLVKSKLKRRHLQYLLDCISSICKKLHLWGILCPSMDFFIFASLFYFLQICDKI